VIEAIKNFVTSAFGLQLAICLDPQTWSVGIEFVAYDDENGVEVDMVALLVHLAFLQIVLTCASSEISMPDDDLPTGTT